MPSTYRPKMCLLLLIISAALATLANGDAVNNIEAESAIQIYFANIADGVRAFSPKISEVTVVTTESTVGIAYDWRENKLYGCTNDIIWKADADGSELQTVFNTYEYGAFRGISIDPLTGNIYISAGFANFVDYYILVCSNSSSDGFSCAEVLTTRHSLVGNFAFDPANRTVYFSWGPVAYTGNSSIMRMGLDGSDLTEIYTTEDGSPVGLTIDLNTSKLYWADYSKNCIMSSNLEGQDIKVVVQLPSGITSPYGIAQADGRLYWTTTYSLMSSEITGSDVRTHYNATAPFSLMYHVTAGGGSEEGLDCDSDEWVELSACSHIRVPSPGGSFHCLCPANMRLLADNVTCAD